MIIHEHRNQYCFGMRMRIVFDCMSKWACRMQNNLSVHASQDHVGIVPTCTRCIELGIGITQNANKALTISICFIKYRRMQAQRQRKSVACAGAALAAPIPMPMVHQQHRHPTATSAAAFLLYHQHHSQRLQLYHLKNNPSFHSQCNLCDHFGNCHVVLIQPVLPIPIVVVLWTEVVSMMTSLQAIAIWTTAIATTTIVNMQLQQDHEMLQWMGRLMFDLLIMVHEGRNIICIMVQQVQYKMSKMIVIFPWGTRTITASRAISKVIRTYHLNRRSDHPPITITSLFQSKKSIIPTTNK